jgi:hypothetical protein
MPLPKRNEFDTQNEKICDQLRHAIDDLYEEFFRSCIGNSKMKIRCVLTLETKRRNEFEKLYDNNESDIDFKDFYDLKRFLRKEKENG